MPAIQYDYDYYEYGKSRRGSAKAAPRISDSQKKKNQANSVKKSATQSNKIVRKTSSKNTMAMSSRKVATTNRNAVKRKVQSNEGKANSNKATVASVRNTNRASIRAAINEEPKTSTRKTNSKNLEVPNIVSKKKIAKPKEMSLKNAEVMRAPKQKNKKKESVMQKITISLCCFSVLFLICYRSSLINESFKDLNSMKSELERVYTINAQIESEIQTQTDLSNIESYAKYQLGMQKPKDSQIQKVVIEKEDKISTPIVIAEEEENTFWKNLVNDIMNILD